MTKAFVWMTVKRLLGLALIVGISSWTHQDDEKKEKLLKLSGAFRQIQIDVREYAISPDSARTAFKAVVKDLREMYKGRICRAIDSTYFVYPVKCYLPSESIGGHGMGYHDEGFDLFDMEAKGSHPAHDLFVHDKNRDGIDDRTWKPIDILAFSAGVVLATETGWQVDSEYRGGNWIWIYDPCVDALFYYAHNNIVNVQPGQWVRAGEKIAEMGRTGFNAYKKRSPTHLHLMCLKLDQAGLPVPEDTYGWLLQSLVTNDD